MKKRGGEVQQDQCEEGQCQVMVCVPEERMKGGAGREEGGQTEITIQHDRVGACRQHCPADQRHADHEGIERVLGPDRCEPHRRWQIPRQRWGAVAKAHGKTDQREYEDSDTERLVCRQERHVFRHDGRHHAED